MRPPPFLEAMKKILYILLAALLSSCATKTVTELVEVHDTLTVHHHDTTTIYKARMVHDTLHVVTERVITLKETGDTIRITTNNVIHERVEVHDTIDRYRATLDSIKQAIKDIDHKEVVKEKKRPWYQLVIALLLILGGGIAGIWLEHKIKK